MKKAVLLLALPLVVAAGPTIPSTPDLGKAEARCRAGEKGPALLINVTGLKDRQGNLKMELYPSNDEDFLADDNILIMAGKTFRRVEQPVQGTGNVQLCTRIPGPGTYSLIVMHDRDANRKFGLSIDGIAFAGNPRLGWGKPKAKHARVVVVNPGVSQITVVMNYKSGLAFRPIKG